MPKTTLEKIQDVQTAQKFSEPSAQYLVPGQANTGYSYVGDEFNTGGLYMQELAQIYELMYTGTLAPFFPVTTQDERTVLISLTQDALDLPTLVRPGVPVPDSVIPKREFTRIVEPAYFRDNGFIDNYTLGGLRQMGTVNTRVNAAQFVAEQVQKKVVSHNLMLEIMMTQALLGGINYSDPRSQVSIDVPSYIPTHNYFNYKGWDGDLATNTAPFAIPPGNMVQPQVTFTNNKGRKEAYFFQNVAGNKIGVPLTQPDADWVRAIRFLKEFHKRSNKNLLTDICMTSEMYTILQENSAVKAQYGAIAAFPNTSPELVSQYRTSPALGVVGEEITHICGLQIHTFDSIFPDLNDNRRHKELWPGHKIVLFSRTHPQNTMETLGKTVKCIGEAPDLKPGLWVRFSDESAPPNVPGRAWQIGDAFMPYIRYPHWVMVIDACEPDAVGSSSIFNSHIDYLRF